MLVTKKRLRYMEEGLNPLPSYSLGLRSEADCLSAKEEEEKNFLFPNSLFYGRVKRTNKESP
jgi:hypothetical protein